MLSRKKSNLLVGFLLVTGDAVVIYLGLVLAFWARFEFFAHQFGKPEFLNYLRAFVLVTIIFMFVFRSFGLYNRQWDLVNSSELLRIAKATAGGIVVMMVPAFMFKNQFSYSTGVAVMSFVTVTPLISVFRKAFGRFEIWFFRTHGLNRRILIVGTGKNARALISNIQAAPQLCYDLIGVVALEGEPVDMVEGVPVVARLNELEQVFSTHELDELILTVPTLDHEQKEALIMECEKNLIDFKKIPDMYEVLMSHIEVVSIDGIPLLGLKGIPLDSAWNRFLKRCLDLTIAGLGLVLLAPFLLVVAILIKLDSRGPIFYRQERCGEDGTPFYLYKLRSMVTDAEVECCPQMTAQQDARITRMGKFLRKYDIDEVPQLWNVLRGRMSLVGPRPEREYFIRQLKHDIHRYMSRHKIRAGMTGWAQVHGLRQNTSFDERVKYDLFYMENWSLWLDIRIIFMTFSRRTRSYEQQG